MLACAAEGSPTNDAIITQPVVQAKPPEGARQDPPDRADRAARFERFRAQLQARLDRHGHDLERLRPQPEITRVPLQHRFGHAVVARRNADGNLDYGCFSDATEGARFMSNATADEAPR